MFGVVESMRKLSCAECCYLNKNKKEQTKEQIEALKQTAILYKKRIIKREKERYMRGHGCNRN